MSEKITEQSCIEDGHCKVHGQEIERRKQASKDIDAMKADIKELFRKWDDQIPSIKMKVFAIFVSIFLFLFLVAGSYSYTAISNANDRADRAIISATHAKEMDEITRRNDRGEEILLNKINTVERDLRLEQTKIMARVVELLTADAERRQWQKGMVTQLQLLNDHIRDFMGLKKSNGTNFSDFGETKK